MKKILLIIPLFFIYSCLHCQTTDISFERISIKEGLSQSSVFAITQDKKGFMWFGTAEGLNKYDGFAFTIYKPDKNDENAISDNWIKCLFVDMSGQLWIGTEDNGINRYDYENDYFIKLKHDEKKPESLSDNKVTSIVEGQEGKIWIGTSNGLNCYDKKSKQVVRYYYNDNEENSLSDNEILSLQKSQNGLLWIGTKNKGLNCFDPKNKTFKHFIFSKSEDEAGINQINDICCDPFYSKDILWLATSNGLLRFNHQTGEIKKYQNDISDKNSICSNQTLTLKLDSNGELWIGTAGGGLARIHNKDKDTGRFQNFSHNPIDQSSLSKNQVYALFEDKSGVLWAGTQGGGINKTKRSHFLHYRNLESSQKGLRHNSVWSIFIDSKNNLWIGYEYELNCFKEGKYFTREYQRYTHNPDNNYGSNSYGFTSICEDNLGFIWLGTRKGGLNRLDPSTGTFKYYENNPTDSNSLIFNYVRKLYKDSRGRIWIGTAQGLSMFMPTKEGNIKFNNFVNIPDDSTSLSWNRVNSVIEDQNKTIWIGTSGGGLNQVVENNGKISFKRFPYGTDNKAVLNDRYVISMNIDNNGTLWVGTYDGGLNKAIADKNGNLSFVHYTTEQGLPNNVIYGILVDKQNELWLTTNKGLSEFNPQAETFKNFDEFDGLQSNEFNRGAFYKASDGRMFVGGINGLNAFYPSKVTTNKYIPPVSLTDFKVLNKSVKHAKNAPIKQHISIAPLVELSYQDYIFTFEFVALSYIAHSKNKYAYMMEGFDKSWIYTDASRRYATYTNMPGGEYTFRVIASNNDGVWNEQGVAIKVIVHPPFWKTWWFITLCITLILGAIFTWYSIRIRNIKRQKEKLEKTVKERTAEVVKQKEQIEKAYENVEMLSKIGKDITMNLSVAMIIEVVYESLNSLLDVPIFTIGVFDTENRRLCFPGTIEKGKTLKDFCYSIDDQNRLAVWCFNNQKEINIKDFDSEYNKYIQEAAPPVVGESPYSIIYLPLNIKNKTIGVISVQSFRKNAYNDYHLNIVRNIAVYTAIAIDNAGAYDRIEYQAKELREFNFQLQEQQEEIRQQSEELATQAEVLQNTNKALEVEKEHTLGSIRYAKTIQEAILPVQSNINRFFESFVIYMPKDIVSGDFYWFSHVNTNGKNLVFLAAVDCTGHGVPGAFMSMIGSRLFNEIVNERDIYDTAEILRHMNQNTRKALKQNQNENDDGMDVCLCRFEIDNHDKTKVSFAGAKRPLFHWDSISKKMNKIDGQRRSIGGRCLNKSLEYFNVEFEIEKTDILYLTSDGFIDQNAPNRKRFGTSRLVKLLEEIASLSLHQQKEILDTTLKDYMKDEQQRDDITLLGIRMIDKR